jgi:hypothetical protein
MMYNMISAAGTDAHEDGTPEALAAKQDIQTLLGAANSQQLPLHFTRKGDQVRAPVHPSASCQSVCTQRCTPH